jgi:phosphohistidine swiveling domain-containing protein
MMAIRFIKGLLLAEEVITVRLMVVGIGLSLVVVVGVERQIVIEVE